MANYVGMKQILAKFWEKEQAANNAAYASKVLEGDVTQVGSVRNLIKTTAKDGYAGAATVSHIVELAAEETFTLPQGATLVSITKEGDPDPVEAVVDTDYTLSSGTYTAVNPITVTYTTPGTTIADELTSIKSELAAKTGFSYEKLPGPDLPVASAETMQKIYLLPKTGGKTGYVEWLTVENTVDNVKSYAWEEIGDTDIDLSNYSTTAEMQTYVTGHAKDATYTEGVTIEDAIDDIDTRVSAMEAAEFGLTINNVAATVDQTGSDTHAAISITAGDIPMSSDANASSIADAIAAAGQVDDVQVSTDGSTYSTVVSNKVAQIDLSDYATKSVDLTLNDSDFSFIFNEE